MEQKDNQQNANNTRVVFSTYDKNTEFGYIPNERAFELHKLFSNCDTYCVCGSVCLALKKFKQPGDDHMILSIDKFKPRATPLCVKKGEEGTKIDCGERIQKVLCPDPFMTAFWKIIKNENCKGE